MSDRRLPVLVWALVLAACAVLVARARFTADMSAFLPQAPTAEQQLLVEQLSDGLVSRLVLVGIEGADPSARAALSRALAARLRADRRFVAVANGEAVSTERDQVLLFERRYALSPAMTPGRFTEAGLRAAISESLDALASPAGLLLKQALPRDPTGEIVQLLDALASESASARNRPRTEGGVWVARDAGRALLLVQTRAAGGDTDGQAAALAALRSAFGAARQEHGPPAADARLVLSGPGVFAVQIRQQIEAEVTRLSLAGTGLIVLLLLVLYRSLPALALGLLPVASGVLVAIAAVSLGFGTVHGLTLGFGTTLIGEAVDYSVYLFVQSRHARAAAGGAAASQDDWMRRFWPTVRLGVLTSLFGFAALLCSGFPGLAQLGLYSMAGLVAAAAVTRWVLPRLLPAGFVVRDVSALGAWGARWAARAGRLRAPVLVALALALAFVATRGDTLWARELAALNPVPLADQARDQALRADLGAPDVRFLVAVSGTSEDAVLQGAEQAQAALAPLVARGAIGGVDSPAQLLPSAATQAARLAAVPPPPVLRERLTAALAGLPIKPERLAPFLEDAERARNAGPVRRADLEGTSLAVAVDGMLVRRDLPDGRTLWRAFLPLHAPAGAAASSPHAPAGAGVLDPAPIRAALGLTGATRPAGTLLLVDLKADADALYSGYLREAVLLSLVGGAAIAVLIAVALRSVRGMLQVMAPLAGAVLLVVAGLAAAGIALNLLHLVGLLLVVAVGSNYALFFADDAMAPTTVASLIVANGAAVLGFGVLAFSSLPVLNAIGLTVGPGAVLALVLSAVFAPHRVSTA